MQTVRTIVCKLSPTPEQAADMDATLLAFALACDHALAAARRIDSTDKVKVQRECYRAIRAEFGLSANLAIRAIARACAAKKARVFEPTSVDFDQRIFSYFESKDVFSLTLLSGRQRIRTTLGDFQRTALAGQNPTSATLVKKGGEYRLHVQVKSVVADPLLPEAFLGVDLGIINLATDSEGECFSGKPVERHRRRHTTARKQYQRRGTKSAKRRLKKLSGRQARYQAWVNHTISKRLVAKAKALGLGIGLEDLSGIRGRCERTANGPLRQRLGNWSFFQLRQFVEYKARSAGVVVILVDAAYTSQTCSGCGHCERANRPSQSVFCCKHCGLSTNADENAALVISARAARKPALKVSGLTPQGQSPRL